MVPFQYCPDEQMQCSEPMFEDVPDGHMVHEVMLGFLKVPGRQRQLLEPAVEVESDGHCRQADIPSAL